MKIVNGQVIFPINIGNCICEDDGSDFARNLLDFTTYVIGTEFPGVVDFSKRLTKDYFEDLNAVECANKALDLGIVVPVHTNCN